MKRAEYHNIHLSSRLAFLPGCLPSSLDRPRGDLHRLYNLHVFLIFPKDGENGRIWREREISELPYLSPQPHRVHTGLKKQNRCTFYVVSPALTHINQQHYKVGAVGNSILQMKKFRQISCPIACQGATKVRHVVIQGISPFYQISPQGHF